MKWLVEISEAAEHDLKDIFDYTHGEHGADQAFKYVASFDGIFDNLDAHPEMGIKRSEIRQGLRSVPKDHHLVFYRILNDRIRIVRILHGSHDLPRQFPDKVDQSQVLPPPLK